MAWYSCEIQFLVQFTPASLGGWHQDARELSAIRDLQKPYLDYLFGQVSGGAAERAARRASLKDFLQSPDCVFLLSQQPGGQDSLPSMDELRQRVGHAIAVYNSLNPDLNFSTRPLGDPSNVRWSVAGSGRVMTCAYELTVIDRHGQPTQLPRDPARVGAYQVGIEVREAL